MPTTVTPNPDTLSATISVPVDGDLATGAGLGALGDNWNAVYFALKRLGHPVTPGPAIRLRADWTDLAGNPSEKTIKLSPLSGIVVQDTAVRIMSKGSWTELGEANLEGGGSFANSALYYVYAYYDSGGGALAFKINQTAPDVYRLFENGGTTARYLGAFATDGSGKPKRSYQDREKSRFWDEQSLYSGAPTAGVQLNPYGNNLVPAHARMVVVKVKVTDSAGSAGTCRIGPFGIVPPSGEGWAVVCPANGSDTQVLTIPVSETGALYAWVNANTTAIVITVLGYDG